MEFARNDNVLSWIIILYLYLTYTKELMILYFYNNLLIYQYKNIHKFINTIIILY